MHLNLARVPTPYQYIHHVHLRKSVFEYQFNLSSSVVKTTTQNTSYNLCKLFSSFTALSLHKFNYLLGLGHRGLNRSKNNDLKARPNGPPPPHTHQLPFISSVLHTQHSQNGPSRRDFPPTFDENNIHLNKSH